MAYQYANRYYERVRLEDGCMIELAFNRKPTAADTETAKGKLEAVRAKEKDTLDPADELDQVKAEKDRLEKQVEQLQAENETLEKEIIELRPIKVEW